MHKPETLGIAAVVAAAFRDSAPRRLEPFWTAFNDTGLGVWVALLAHGFTRVGRWQSAPSR